MRCVLADCPPGQPEKLCSVLLLIKISELGSGVNKASSSVCSKQGGDNGYVSSHLFDLLCFPLHP